MKNGSSFSSSGRQFTSLADTWFISALDAQQQITGVAVKPDESSDIYAALGRAFAAVKTADGNIEQAIRGAVGPKYGDILVTGYNEAKRREMASRPATVNYDNHRILAR